MQLIVYAVLILFNFQFSYTPDFESIIWYYNELDG
jgi:hypothetical protein